MMYLMPYLSLVWAGLLQASSNGLLKYSSEYRKREEAKKYIYYILFSVAIIMTVIVFPFMAYGMSKISLTVSQPLYSVTLFIAAYIFGITFFKEAFIVKQLLGIAVILVGIFLVVI